MGSEMCIRDREKQLRHIDEFIAQITPTDSEGNLLPSSRRFELWRSTLQVHHQRRELLGTIFLKTKEYNRAIDLHLKLLSNTIKPDTDRVEAYKHFLESGKHVHADEVQFLRNVDDLVTFLPKMTLSVPSKEETTWLKKGIEVTPALGLAALSVVLLVMPCLMVMVMMMIPRT